MSAVNVTSESVDDTVEPQEAKWVCQSIAAEGVIGIFGNFLVCFVILRVKFLHNMTNFLLVNLAVADLLRCVQIFFFYLMADKNCTLTGYIPNSTGEKELFCRILASAFLDWTLSVQASYSLCLVALERYVAIVHPLQYGRKLTLKRISILIALVWVMGCLQALPGLFTYEPSDDPERPCRRATGYHESLENFLLFGAHSVHFTMVFVLPVGWMCWAYYKIQLTLKRQAQALNLRQARAAAYDLVVARQRLMNMLTIVLGALIVLMTPAQIESLICLHPSKAGKTSICTSDAYKHIRGVCNFLFYFNSVINPIIYVFRYKKFQHGLKVALCGHCYKQAGNNRVDHNGLVMAPL